MKTADDLIMIKHGSRYRRKKGPPEAGLNIDTDSFSVSYVPPHIIDLKLKTADNFMVMQLGPSRAEGAFNSDKLRPLQLGPGYPIIGLTGSEFNCKATSTKGVIINSIAESGGFSSDSNFGTFFKKYVGMAPIAYRRLYFR